jgi:hypothetical protein
MRLWTAATAYPLGLDWVPPAGAASPEAPVPVPGTVAPPAVPEDAAPLAEGVLVGGALAGGVLAAELDSPAAGVPSAGWRVGASLGVEAPAVDVDVDVDVLSVDDDSPAGEDAEDPGGPPVELAPSADPVAEVDARAWERSAAAACPASAPGCAARNRSAPGATSSMPRRVALDSTRSPAASSEFSMFSAEFSRWKSAARSSERPMLALSLSSPSWRVTIPINAKATSAIHTRPRIRRSSRL